MVVLLYGSVLVLGCVYFCATLTLTLPVAAPLLGTFIISLFHVRTHMTARVCVYANTRVINNNKSIASQKLLRTCRVAPVSSSSAARRARRLMTRVPIRRTCHSASFSASRKVLKVRARRVWLEYSRALSRVVVAGRGARVVGFRSSCRRARGDISFQIQTHLSN